MEQAGVSDSFPCVLASWTSSLSVSKRPGHLKRYLKYLAQKPLNPPSKPSKTTKNTNKNIKTLSTPLETTNQTKTIEEKPPNQ